VQKKSRFPTLENSDLIRSSFTWRTFRLGGYSNSESLLRDMRATGCVSSGMTSQLMQDPAFPLDSTERDVTFARITPKHFGYKDRVSRWRFVQDVAEAGFALCPAEAGPQIRRQYLDQMSGEVLEIVSESLGDPPSYIFTVTSELVGSTRVRRLDTYLVSPHQLLQPDTKLVFVCRH
jgi:hypothetical protein